jgi:hypothetical protein
MDTFKMNEVGVIYLAFGAPYLAMALTSMASLRVFNPNAPVCVVTNVCRRPPNLWSSVQNFDWTFVDEVTSNNRIIKTNMYQYSPFEKTLYLDCDTLILSDISQILFFLEHFDLVLKHYGLSEVDSETKQMLFDGTVRFGDIGHFNSGVLGFRRGAKVERFFDYWNGLYRRYGKRDQPSLVEALYLSDVRLLPLPRRWNEGDLTFSDRRRRNETAIWHYKVRGMDRYLESYMLRASRNFFDDLRDLESVETYIQYCRKTRGYGRRFRWLLKALIKGMRGPLSKRPPKHVGKENWRRMLGDCD